MAAGEIDDRQAAHAEDDVLVAMEALVVRSAMHDGAGHAAHLFQSERSCACCRERCLRFRT